MFTIRRIGALKPMMLHGEQVTDDRGKLKKHFLVSCESDQSGADGNPIVVFQSFSDSLFAGNARGYSASNFHVFCTKLGVTIPSSGKFDTSMLIGMTFRAVVAHNAEKPTPGKVSRVFANLDLNTVTPLEVTA